MISKNILIIIGILFIALSMKSVDAQEWRDGDGGKVKWQFDCDFFGYDIKNQQIPGEQCGSLCINTNGCSHFSHFNGVCYLKKVPNGTPRQPAAGGLCGFITSAGTLREFIGIVNLEGPAVQTTFPDGY
jgi:hypothetical protein